VQIRSDRNSAEPQTFILIFLHFLVLGLPLHDLRQLRLGDNLCWLGVGESVLGWRVWLDLADHLEIAAEI